jgi:class 3 adenylate cyclase/tetratricopeptide (TPR) repeat protein
MSERLDPETVTDIMNRCFADLEGIIAARSGRVDKYIGDAVMAIFGIDGGDADSVLAAVNAAAEIRDAVTDFNRREQLAVPLGVHLGIASGQALISAVGGARKRRLSATGRPVTMASKLEDISSLGEILVDRETYEKSTSEIEYEQRAPAAPTGQSDAEPVYEYRGYRRLRSRIRRDSERRQASVLFAAIRGIDELAAALPPDELNRILNQCFAELEEVVEFHGGVIDKAIGHTVMALFGVPDAIQDAPKQAVNAAIEMRKRIAETPLPEGRGSLVLGVGVNTGLVIAGELGGRVHRDFTVMGDTVNLAARLKEASSAGEILVGPETNLYTRADFEFAPPRLLNLKGKRKPVAAYSVLSEKKQLRRSRAAHSGQLMSVLVGRESELAALRRLFERLDAGRGGMASVVGDAGVGKSRLTVEVLGLDFAKRAHVLQAPSVSIGQNLPFHPFVHLLRDWTDIHEEDSRDDATARLRAKLEPILEDADEHLPFIASVMGLEVSGELAARIERIDGETLQRLIARSLREVLRGLARSQPLVVFFEDLHWADQSSIQLLQSLIPLANEEPILFLNACRPGFAATAERMIQVGSATLGDGHVLLDLEPLREQDAATLIQNLLGVDHLPRKVRRLITAKTEGNPFFVEEVIHSLIESNVIQKEGDHYAVSEDVAAMDIPGTIQEAIMARVDRLAPATRQVVQIASVIGRSFFYSIIREIMRRNGQLDEHCAEELRHLQERDLIVERDAVWSVPLGTGSAVEEIEYVFKHALAQETIYASLLQKVRTAFHETIAETIEESFSERLSDFYGTLAYHFGRAENLPKAEDYLFRAGEGAARTAASREALELFREASRLYLRMYGEGGDPLRKAEIEKSIGLALLNTGAITESIAHFDRALSHFGVSTPRSVIAANGFLAFNAALLFCQLYLGIGRKRHVENWTTEQHICDAQFNRARAQITSDPIRLVYDSIHAFRRFNEIDMTRIQGAPAMYASAAGMFCYSALSFSVGRKALDHTRRLAEHGDIHDHFTYRTMEYIFHYLLGDWKDAEKLAIGREEIDAALRGGQVWDVNTYAGLESDQRTRQGNFARSRELFDVLEMLAVDYGFEFAADNLLGMTALYELERRELEKALTTVGRYTVRVAENPLRLLGLATKAKTEVLLGDLAAAHGSLQAAVSVADSLTTPPWHMSAFATARLHYALARWQKEPGVASLRREAFRAARKARVVARKVAMQRPEIHRLCGAVHWLAGRHRRAHRAWKEAIELANTMGAQPELARTYRDMGRLLTGRVEGERCREQAAMLFAELGLDRELA